MVHLGNLKTLGWQIPFTEGKIAAPRPGTANCHLQCYQSFRLAPSTLILKCTQNNVARGHCRYAPLALITILKGEKKKTFCKKTICKKKTGGKRGKNAEKNRITSFL